MDPEHLKKLLAGDQRTIARLMTQAENDLNKAADIVQSIYSHTGKAYIIGITGAPGAGKSTFVNALTKYLVDQGKCVGIIAVDPSSPFSGGAILGDRIRMKQHFTSQQVFIRSMATRGMLGGLARASKDVVKILDAGGYDYILLETVGVGQSEVEIYKTAHTTVLLVTPEMGDEIQTLKAGIMEITDVFVVNKADLDGANKRVAEIESMLDLDEKIQVNEENHSVQTIRIRGWRPPVLKVISTTGTGIEEFMTAVTAHRQFCAESPNGQEHRRLQLKYEILEILKEGVTTKIENLLHSEENEEIERELTQLLERKTDPYSVSKKIGRMIASLTRR